VDGLKITAKEASLAVAASVVCALFRIYLPPQVSRLDEFERILIWSASWELDQSLLRLLATYR